MKNQTDVLFIDPHRNTQFRLNFPLNPGYKCMCSPRSTGSGALIQTALREREAFLSCQREGAGTAPGAGVGLVSSSVMYIFILL